MTEMPPASIMRSFSLAQIAVTMVLLSGCASQPSVFSAWSMPSLPTPRVTPLPLTVGVHYSEDFEHKKHRDDSRFYTGWHQPGGASVKLFDSVLAATFERVVRVSHYPPTATSDLALIVVPKVSGVTGKVALDRTRSYGIRYEVSLLDSDGRQVDRWDVGASSEQAIFSTYDAHTAVVLRAVTAELLVNLRERPEVRMRIAARERASFAEATAMAPSKANGFAILGDSNWVNCMKHPLTDEKLAVLDIGAEQFRDAMFPWFEPNVTQPTTAEGWTRLLSEPKARAAAAELGIRYVLVAQGNTQHDMRGGGLCGITGCVGAQTGTRNTSLSIALIDFARAEVVAETNFSESGSAHAVVLGLLPLAVATPTESNACQKAAAEVGQLVKSR